MTDTEFETLKANEAKAYEAYDAAGDVLRSLGDKWLPLKQQLDRENMRREMMKEMSEKH